MEANPDDVTSEFVATLQQLPINRISMGTQTFDDERLKFLHRRHTASQVPAAVSALRQAGFKNISIDLMYGFPNQTLDEWKTDIDEAFGAGQEAVRQAVHGETGKVVAFEREMVEGKYHCKGVAIPLTAVANVEKKIPAEWINAEENGLTQEFIDYVRPLVQGRPDYPMVDDAMPRYANLRKVLANQNG